MSIYQPIALTQAAEGTRDAISDVIVLLCVYWYHPGAPGSVEDRGFSNGLGQLGADERSVAKWQSWAELQQPSDIKIGTVE